jgi:hypothetical protein
VNDEEIAQLEDESEWDFESAERVRAPRGNRAVVSVGFKTAEFTLVSAAAEKRGQPLSRFIREAALDRARGHDAEVATQCIHATNFHIEHERIEAMLLDVMRSRGRLSALR